MFNRAIIALAGLLSLGALVLNAVWLVVLALPFSWLWNWTLVPLVRVPVIGYWRALGLLLLWHLLHLVGEGVKLSAKLHESE
jgi:hypothetical protein